jgi:hypothetical protein
MIEQRKIIKMSAIKVSGDSAPKVRFFALCDDGSLWSYVDDDKSVYDSFSWVQINTPPEKDNSV